MDSVTAVPSPIPRLVRWLVAALALGYAWLIYQQASPFAAGSDSSGYLNSARLLAAGQFVVEARPTPGYPPPWPFYSHTPLGFGVQGASGMSPTYPIGLPLHLLACAPIVGWEKTARVVNALNVLAAGGLLYALGRRLGLGRPWALAGVAALWLSPLWLMFAIQPMSDPLATTWTLAALLAALRSRERWPWALAAGAALGMSVLVRPANLLVALPLAVALGLPRPRWRAWLACGLGGVPFAAAMLAYNARAYGDPFTTGYGFVGEAFSLGIVPHNLAHFALWLPLLVGAPLALAGLALPWVRGTADAGLPAGWLLGSWVLVFVAFYASYWFAGETWWYVRFLLPAFPALICAGLLVLQRLAGRRRAWHYTAAALLLAGFVSQRVLTSQLLNFSIRDGERRYYRACVWLRENLPAGAIVASCQLSGAQYYYTDFPLLRWDQLPREEMTKAIRGLRAAQHPLYAVLFTFEEEPALRQHLPGRWTKLRDLETDIGLWRFESLP